MLQMTMRRHSWLFGFKNPIRNTCFIQHPQRQLIWIRVSVDNLGYTRVYAHLGAGDARLRGDVDLRIADIDGGEIVLIFAGVEGEDVIHSAEELIPGGRLLSDSNALAQAIGITQE